MGQQVELPFFPGGEAGVMVSGFWVLRRPRGQSSAPHSQMLKNKQPSLVTLLGRPGEATFPLPPQGTVLKKALAPPAPTVGRDPGEWAGAGCCPGHAEHHVLHCDLLGDTV